MRCHRCGTSISFERKIGRQETCPECDSYLHCCLNCRFFDESAYHQCREPQAEWVNEKDAANFCDCFEPGKSQRRAGSSRSDEVRKKLDALFGETREGDEDPGA